MAARRYGREAGAIALVVALGASLVAAADFEVAAPDGRRILMKDDGTWRYLDQKGEAAPKKTEEAPLRLQRKTETDNGCRFELQLENTLTYEIYSFFPSLSAYRANGVLYDSVSFGFQALKPGDTQTRAVIVRGLACKDIARVQVTGGDRCVMGDLDRFSAPPGACLARVRPMQSDLVQFDK